MIVMRPFATRPKFECRPNADGGRFLSKIKSMQLTFETDHVVELIGHENFQKRQGFLLSWSKCMHFLHFQDVLGLINKISCFCLLKVV